MLALVLAVAPAPADVRGPSFEERVAAQRAIEQVYWNHRLWPAGSAQPKPPLSAVLPEASLRRLVEDYLSKSTALDDLWHHPITGEQLQAEMERMARDTRDPDLLRELFAALWDDPRLIAETLARQALADRLVREAYATDSKLHEATRRLAEKALVFDEWWARERGRFDAAVPGVGPEFTLPAIAVGSCSNDTWTPTSTDPPDAPTARNFHSAVWTGVEMIIWGGSGTGPMLNTGGRYTPSTDSWAATSTGANVPSGRYYHTAVWSGTEMIVWGGNTGAQLVNTGGRYNPTTNTWTSTSIGTNVPAARILHTAVWANTEMIIWGGSDASVALNTGGRYNPTTNTWTPTPVPAITNAARAYHSAIWTGTEMIIWGGITTGAGSYLNSGMRLNAAANIWTQTSAGTNVPAARQAHTAVWTGTEMIVWGGNTAGPTSLNTGGRYKVSNDTWSTTSTSANCPAARTGHTAVWTGFEMIVWGVSGVTGGRYNPTTDAWAATPTVNAPSSRQHFTAVWTGSEMIVWGGGFGLATGNDGGRYCACTTLAYRDADVDGYGNPNIFVASCGSTPAGYVTNPDDCDDADAQTHPGASDAVCNGIDNNCNGQFDEQVPGGGCNPTITIPSTDRNRDNTLYETAAPSDTSNGSGTHMIVGVIDDTNPAGLYGKKRRGVIYFDLTQRITPGANITVVGARLDLYAEMGRNPSDGTPTTMSIHQVNREWGEAGSNSDHRGDGHMGFGGGQGEPAGPNDATWRYGKYPLTPWTAGGDFVSTPSATMNAVSAAGLHSWIASPTQNAAMLADIESWIADPTQNFGWLVKIDNENTRHFTRRFASRENTTIAFRPKLQIMVVTDGTTGACCYSGPNGQTCEELGQAACDAYGGAYAGDNTTCAAASPCVVACCAPAGTCTPATAAACVTAGGTPQGDNSSCSTAYCSPQLTPFLDPLPIPAIATPVSGTPGDVATYNVAIQEFTQQLHSQLPATLVWGYDHKFPGPTFKAFYDKPVTVNWINDLHDTRTAGTPLRTTHVLPVDMALHGVLAATPRLVTHLHGGHVPAAADGYPEATFLPGASATYVYPNHQDAATLWYHDHALGITRLNVMMGLAGMYLLRDPVEASLSLPNGEYEIPLIIQDRSFNADGSLHYVSTSTEPDWHERFFGDKTLVNGKVWPYLNVKKGKYRFRLLNASNSRVYTLAMNDAANQLVPFYVIGSDNGLLSVPMPQDSVTLSPGERMDVVLNFAPYGGSQQLILRNSAPAPFPGSPNVGVVKNVMKFNVMSPPGYQAPLPTSLRAVTQLPPPVVTRSFALGMTDGKWTITSTGTLTGHDWNDITEFPRLGDTEIWSFVNNSTEVHPIHLHLVRFQVVDRRDEDGALVPLLPDEAGWKDTVRLGPHETVRLVMKFEDYTGKFPYHCHILEHEDNEMMRQFKVLSPNDVLEGAAEITALGLGYPNPSHGRMRIEFALASRANTRVEIEDVAGRRVMTLIDAPLEPGRHVVMWDGHQSNGETARAGFYFYRLFVDDRSISSRRMVMIR